MCFKLFSTMQSECLGLIIGIRLAKCLMLSNCIITFYDFCFPLPEYIWDSRNWMTKDNQGKELEQWLYLPDYITPPNSYKLVADFFQLLLVSFQWRVFRQEMSSNSDVPDGGTNEDITPEVEAKSVIPVDDFTTKIT